MINDTTMCRSLFEGLKTQNLDLEELCRRVGVEKSVLHDPDVRIPLSKRSAIWREARSLSEDKALGLHIGEKALPGFFGIAGYIAMSSLTLEQGIRQFIQYKETHNQDKIDFEINNNISVIRYRLQEQETENSIYIIEAFMSGLITLASQITGKNITPTEVKFRHGKTDYLDEYKRIFQSRLSFRQKHNEILLKSSQLTLPLLQANPGLNNMFGTYANERRKTINNQKSYPEKVSNLLIQELQKKTPDIVSIACILGVSKRTLQRKLKEAGTSYSEVLKSTKINLSLHLLQNTDISIDKIVYRAGFSDKTTFYRAFKNWTGLTPREYRLKGKLNKRAI